MDAGESGEIAADQPGPQNKPPATGSSMVADAPSWGVMPLMRPTPEKYFKKSGVLKVYRLKVKSRK